MQLPNKDELFSALVVTLKKNKIRLNGDILAFKENLYDTFLDFTDEEDEDATAEEVLAEFFDIILLELVEQDAPERASDNRFRAKGSKSSGIDS